MALRIVLTGGGSGGHVFPLTQVAKKIQAQEPSAKFLFLGPKSKLEREIMSAAGIKQKSVASGRLYRYFTFRYFLTMVKMPWGFLQALWHLFWFMPDVVFAKGGFASVPVVVAAKLFFIPVLIHESDAKPGLANLFLGSLATKVALTFERAKIHFPPTKTIITGSPVNPNALGGKADAGRKFMGIRKEVKPVLLVMGGSQGAQFINLKIIELLPDLTKRFQIIHQTGKNNFELISQLAERKGYKIGRSDYYPVAFLGEEMKDVMALAKVVISRGGATSIAEIAANAKPAILVPITKSANNHQRINAFEVSRLGGAIVIEEVNFKKTLLLNELDHLNKDEQLREKLAKNVQQFYQADAADKLAEQVLQLARD